MCAGECVDLSTCKICNDRLESGLSTEVVSDLASGELNISPFYSKYPQDIGKNVGLNLPEGNCEAFGVGCVCLNMTRTLSLVQRCKTCCKIFDLACKHAYSPNCEKEEECGCCDAVNSDSALDGASANIPEAINISSPNMVM